MVSSILFGVILLFFQIFKASALSIWGIVPNVLIGYSAYLGAYKEEKYSLPIIFFLSLGYDLVTPETLGINTLLLLLVCWVTGILKKSILEPKLVTVAILSLLYNMLYYLIFGLFFSLETENMNYIFTTFGLSVVINSLFTIILFYFLLLLSHLKISIR